MLLQEGPADTFDFMVLGMAVILGLMTIYVVSLITRWRNARRELQLLEDLDQEQTD
ncbi:MAG: hypothetical protein R3191_00790 [Anaerolineales bacterium]|nr:hypothetical protein [Anaerolineales bacterium]